MLYFIGNTLLLMFFLLSLAIVSSASELEKKEASFELSDLKESLEDNLSTKLDRSHLKVKNIIVKRTDSKKTFNLSDIRNINLPSKFSISKISVNDNKNKFEANISPEKGDYEIEAYGNFTALQRLPVLSSSIKKGDIITQNDIELKFIDNSTIKATTILDITKIIGKTASRNLKRGSLIQFNNIKDPILIKRNKAVNAIYKVKNIEVKTVAIALQDGKEGDIIKLRNHESGKIFQAIVDKEGNVNTNIQGHNDNFAASNEYRNRNIN